MNKTAASALMALIIGVAAGVVGVRWFGGEASEAGGPPSVGQRAPVAAEASKPIVQGPPAPLVHTTPVVSVVLPRSVAAVGSLRSKDSVMLRPEIAGRISEIHFADGASVGQGEILLQLDDSVVRAQLQQAEANLSLASSQRRRAAELSKQGFISSQAVDDAVNQLRVQQAAVALAKAQLDKTTIVAPFAGMIGLRSVSAGDYVSPGTDLVRLESIDPLQVDFRVPEHYLGMVQQGQPLSVSFDALAGISRAGAVDAINPLVDVGGRSILLRANIPNPDNLLRPGLFARVSLQFSNAQALIVPEAALAPAGESQYVFRINNGRAERVEVETGQRRDGNVEIISGLTEGDEVVIAGIQKITDGSPVRVDNKEKLAAVRYTSQPG